MMPRRLAHLRAHSQFQPAAVLGLVTVAAILVRLHYFGQVTSDYSGFLKPWWDYLAAHGLAAFHDNFANYNAPYLVILWIGTHLTSDSLAYIKTISLLFDLLMAGAAYKICSVLHPSGHLKYYAAAVVLFLPTVIINSAWWGQCDSVYTSILLLAIYASLRQRIGLMWLLWGVSLAFKPQAVFLLPFVVYASIAYRGRWYQPGYAAAAFVVLSALPILCGRSVSSTFSVYTSQASGDYLTLNAPNLYQVLPQGPGYHALELWLGYGLATVVLLSFAALGWRHRRHPSPIHDQLLLLATISVVALPYVLPGMHERYFYPAEILLAIYACYRPRFIPLAAALQTITILSMRPYMAGQWPLVSYRPLGLAVGGLLLTLMYQLFKTSQTNPADQKI